MAKSFGRSAITIHLFHRWENWEPKKVTCLMGAEPKMEFRTPGSFPTPLTWQLASEPHHTQVSNGQKPKLTYCPFMKTKNNSQNEGTRIHEPAAQLPIIICLLVLLLSKVSHSDLVMCVWAGRWGAGGMPDRLPRKTCNGLPSLPF